MASGDLLPDDGSHVIKARAFAELDDLGPYRDHLISSIVNGTGELIPYVNTQATTLMKNPVAVIPNQVQIINIFLIGVVEPYLFSVSIVL